MTLILIFCVIFANFYAIRRIEHYGLELYLYDRLLVAYDTGSRNGMDKELKNIISDDKMPRERKLAEEFQAKLINIKDLQGYLKDIVAEKRSKVMLLRNLRLAAVILMLLILGLRLLINLKFCRR